MKQKWIPQQYLEYLSSKNLIRLIKRKGAYAYREWLRFKEICEVYRLSRKKIPVNDWLHFPLLGLEHSLSPRFSLAQHLKERKTKHDKIYIS